MGAAAQELENRFYCIPVQFTAVAAGASTTTLPAVNIGPRPFTWKKLGIAYTVNTTWTIRITDNGRDIAFMPQEVDIETLVDVNGRPHELQDSYTFDAGSSIMVAVTNTSGVPGNLHLTFIGARH